MSKPIPPKVGEMDEETYIFNVTHIFAQFLRKRTKEDSRIVLSYLLMAQAHSEMGLDSVVSDMYVEDSLNAVAVALATLDGVIRRRLAVN